MSNTVNLDDLAVTEDLAKIAQVSIQSIFNWKQNRSDFPAPVATFGHQQVFSKRAFNAFLKANNLPDRSRTGPRGPRSETNAKAKKSTATKGGAKVMQATTKKTNPNGKAPRASATPKQPTAKTTTAAKTKVKAPNLRKPVVVKRTK